MPLYRLGCMQRFHVHHADSCTWLWCFTGHGAVAYVQLMLCIAGKTKLNQVRQRFADNDNALSMDQFVRLFMPMLGDKPAGAHTRVPLFLLRRINAKCLKNGFDFDNLPRLPAR